MRFNGGDPAKNLPGDFCLILVHTDLYIPGSGLFMVDEFFSIDHSVSQSFDQSCDQFFGQSVSQSVVCSAAGASVHFEGCISRRKITGVQMRVHLALMAFSILDRFRSVHHWSLKSELSAGSPLHAQR